MDPGKSSNLSQIDEEMNFTLSKLHSTEIKESIRIVESNILPDLKNSVDIKPPDSNFKKTFNKDKEIKETEESEDPKEKNEGNNEKENEQIEKPNVNNMNAMLIVNNNKIPDEKSLTISPNKEESRINSEKPPEDEESKSLGKYLNFVKKNRKQVNLEAQILANRIALLKQEELKTLKKIKETKNKADEIYRLKRQNYEKTLERANQLKQTRDNISNKILDKKFAREHSKENQENFRTTFQKQRQEEMMSIRKESQRNQAIKTGYERKLFENNLAKVGFVKKQLLIGNLKVEEYKTNKMLRVKREYERKINEEKNITKKSEMDIMEMEKMELELIRKLQQSQYIQKTVYEELEGALTLPLLEYENKYKKNEGSVQNEKKRKKKKPKKKKENLTSNNLKLESFKF